MNQAITMTNVKLDTAVTPNTWLIPKSMVLLKDPIVGYNNVLRTSSGAGTRFGYNNGLNYQAPSHTVQKVHQESGEHLETLVVSSPLPSSSPHVATPTASERVRQQHNNDGYNTHSLNSLWLSGEQIYVEVVMSLNYAGFESDHSKILARSKRHPHDPKLSVIGAGRMSGPIDMAAGSAINNVADPVDDSDAMNKRIVEQLLSNYFKTLGYNVVFDLNVTKTLRSVDFHPSGVKVKSIGESSKLVQNNPTYGPIIGVNSVGQS